MGASTRSCRRASRSACSRAKRPPSRSRRRSRRPRKRGEFAVQQNFRRRGAGQPLRGEGARPDHQHPRPGRGSRRRAGVRAECDRGYRQPGDEIPVSSCLWMATFPRDRCLGEAQHRPEVSGSDLCIQCASAPELPARRGPLQGRACEHVRRGARGQVRAARGDLGDQRSPSRSRWKTAPAAPLFESCPAKDKTVGRKALTMQPQVREEGARNWEFFLELPICRAIPTRCASTT